MEPFPAEELLACLNGLARGHRPNSAPDRCLLSWAELPSPWPVEVDAQARTDEIGDNEKTAGNEDDLRGEADKEIHIALLVIGRRRRDLLLGGKRTVRKDFALIQG
jgi:hypothetical protein